MGNQVSLFIGGVWGDGSAGQTLPFRNPATNEVIGEVAVGARADLDRALEAADSGFRVWRAMSSFDRYKALRAIAEILRSRAAEIGELLTLEQGKQSYKRSRRGVA